VRLLFRETASRGRAFGFAGVLLAMVGLCGCVETAADIAPGAPDQTQFVRRPDATLSAASLAIMSVEGAPDEQTAIFQQTLDAAAAQRQIAVAAPDAARYLAKGYLSAELVKDGASVDIVWDVFTPDKQRVQRLSDTIVVRGSGDDAWAMVSGNVLATVAAKSADDLAAYLSNTPEAAPGAALSYAE
jgi:hypothetical protein